MSCARCAVSAVVMLLATIGTHVAAAPVTLDLTTIVEPGKFLARPSNSTYSPAGTGFSFSVGSVGNRPGSNVADRNHNFSPARGLGIEGPLSGNAKTALEPAGSWNWDRLRVNVTKVNGLFVSNQDWFIMGFDLIMDQRAPTGSVGFNTTSLVGTADIPGSLGFHNYITEPLVYDADVINARISFDITPYLNEQLLDRAKMFSGRTIDFYPLVGTEYGPGFWVASITLGTKADILAAQQVGQPGGPVAAVPIPATLPLLAAALGALGAFRRRRA